MPSMATATRTLHLRLRLRQKVPLFLTPPPAAMLPRSAAPLQKPIALRLRVRMPPSPPPRRRRRVRAAAEGLSSAPRPSVPPTATSPSPPPHAAASEPEPASEPDADAEWTRLDVPDGLLRLSLTMNSGQVFRWVHTGRFKDARSATGESDEWAGTLGTHAYLLRQAVRDGARGHVYDAAWFRCLNVGRASRDGSDAAEAVLRDFLNADTDVGREFARFARADARFRAVQPYLCGMRLLRTPVAECVFSFICSSNNHLRRIAGMVTHLANAYGPLLATCRTAQGETVCLHAFPSVETLARDVTEAALREAGFGYRARFVAGAATQLVQAAAAGGYGSVDALLHAWRGDAGCVSRAERAARLTALPGVGRKVAGCVLLMALDDRGEVPVDTHVWRIARRYLPHLHGKSLTPRVYDAIGDFFRDRFGPWAGVAHNVLFVAELPEYRRLLPDDVVRIVRGGDEGETGVEKGAKKAAKPKAAKTAKAQTTLALKKRKRAVVKSGAAPSDPKKARKVVASDEAGAKKKRQSRARGQGSAAAEG